MPLKPALRRQRQGELCEFQASLVCTVISKTARLCREMRPHNKQANKQKIDN